jgi:hypothetical protein
MATTVKFGSISFGGFKLFALPENYQVTSIGNKSKPIARAGGTILDVGYGYRGFTIRTYVENAGTVIAIDAYAKSRLQSALPITVVDTLYPGGKTWSGFFEVPIVSAGKVDFSNTLGLPSALMLDETTLTFYSIAEEVM